MKKWIAIAMVAVLAGAAWWALALHPRGSDGHSHAGEGAAEGSEKVMYNCAMHPSYISDKPGKCPFCGMDLTPMKAHAKAPDSGPGSVPAGMPARVVRIDPATVQNIGVRTEPVGKREMSAEIRTSGRIAVDETRQFSINARVMGWAEKLYAASTGQPVRKGQPLLDLYSPELVSTQEEYLQALRYVRNLNLSRTSGPPGAGGHASEARRAASDLLESSRRRLLNWDFPESGIKSLESRGTVERTVPILSPANGVVLEKMVMQGQNVTPGMPLYRIADLSKVWVVASIYQADLARVKVGSPAGITLSYLPGKDFKGKVAFVSPVLDPQTRTAEVRVEVANTAALDLKPEMFASVTLRPPASVAVVAVPEQAIIRTGKRNIAIVALGDGYFEPRDVLLGRVAEGYAEVLEGLKEGETLVVSSQFLIDSESNLKAAVEQMRSQGEGRPAAIQQLQARPLEDTGMAVGGQGMAAPASVPSTLPSTAAP